MLLFLLPLSEEQKNNEHLLIKIHISVTSQEAMGLCLRFETQKKKDKSQPTWEKILNKV